MNKRGQALVEFIIVLPILIMIIFGIVDYSLILKDSSYLESKLSTVIDMYNDGETNREIEKYLNLNEKINLDINTDNKYVTITLKKEREFITPGLGLILDNPYNVTVKRIILNEK